MLFESKMKYTSYKTAYNRHIRLACEAARGERGYERAEAIKGYFLTTAHPHVNYTFDQMAMNRLSDREFAIDLLQELADITAKNEQGYTLPNVDGRFHFEVCVGSVSYNNVSVNRYSVNGDDSKQLITVEYNSKVHGYAVFESFDAYSEWLDSLMENVLDTGLNRIWHIANRLDLSWSTNEE